MHPKNYKKIVVREVKSKNPVKFFKNTSQGTGAEIE